MNNLKESSLLSIKNVEASLSYGKIYSDKIWNVVFFVILFLAVSLVSLATYILLYEVQGAGEESASALGSVIGGYSIGSFILIVDLLMYLYVNYGRIKAKTFLVDAVILDAETRSLGDGTEIRFPAITASACAIRVKFYFDGRKIIKDSVHKDKLVYLPIFKHYADRKIKIAYSPKYDEVLILKDERKK